MNRTPLKYYQFMDNISENALFTGLVGYGLFPEKLPPIFTSLPWLNFFVNNTTMTYEVTPSFNGVTVGEIAQLSPIGEILPMYLDLVYTFIQSGINSNSVQIFLNGESLYFEKCSLSRVRLAESNTFAGGKSTKTVIQNNGLSIDLNAPLLDTTQSGVIEDDVLDGGNNVAQCVQYVRGTKVRNYIMVFGNTTENLEMAKNIGANVSLVEGKQDILSYNEHWQTYSVTVGAGQTVTIGTAVSEFKGVAFFGDGTSGTSTTGTFEHTYENAGTYIVRVFNLYNIKVVTFYVDDEVYESVEVDYGDLVEQPENPTKTGYDFDKWYLNAELTTEFNFSNPITENTNAYAGFVLANYTITYNLNGGTNSPNNPSTYTMQSATITLENATKTGFTFDGWYEDSEFTTQITQIETGSYGDIDLYAKFTVTPYTVTITPSANTNISVTRTASPNGDAELGTLESGDNVYYRDALTVSYAYTGSANTFKLISETNEIRNENYSKNVYVQLANATYTCYAVELITLKDTATSISITHGTAGQTFTDTGSLNGLIVPTNIKNLVLDGRITITYYTEDGLVSDAVIDLSNCAEIGPDGEYYINTLTTMNVGAVDELEMTITATANTIVITNVTDNARTFISNVYLRSIKQYQ